MCATEAEVVAGLEGVGVVGGPAPAPSQESPPAAGLPLPPWSTPAITACPCPPRPSSCHRTPISPWPARPWKPSTRPTRCSAESSSNPESRLHVGTRLRFRPHQPHIRRPVRPAAPAHPGRNARGSPRRRRPPRANKPPPPTSRSRSISPPGYRTSSKPFIQFSTKRPPHRTEPDSSCRGISPDLVHEPGEVPLAEHAQAMRETRHHRVTVSAHTGRVGLPWVRGWPGKRKGRPGTMDPANTPERVTPAMTATSAA